MEENKITNEKLIKVEDIIMFILLILWIFMPVFKSLRKSYEIFQVTKYYFGLMRITGITGIVFGVYNIIVKIKKSNNKKETIKELLPIFLFVLYMIWTLISCFYSPDKNLAFEGTAYRKEGYFMYLIYAGYFLCAFLIDSKILKKVLLNIFVIVTIFLICVSFLSENNTQFNAIFINNTVDHSVFAQFNHYGYFLMMTLMCCFGLFVTEKNKILKVVYALEYTVLGFALIYNNTFGCYLATIIILVLYAIYSIMKKKNRIEVLIGIIIFIILSCITTSEGENLAYKNLSSFTNDIKVILSKFININVEENEELEEELEEEFEKAGTSRMKLWKYGIQFFIERPILGYGPENLRMKYLDVSIKQDRPHNLLIQLATTSGLPGLILYATAVGIIVFKGIKALIKTNDEGQIFLIVVITYLISAMFGNSMYYTSPYFFIFLGMLLNWNLSVKVDKNKKQKV